MAPTRRHNGCSRGEPVRIHLGRCARALDERIRCVASPGAQPSGAPAHRPPSASQSTTSRAAAMFVVDLRGSAGEQRDD